MEAFHWAGLIFGALLGVFLLGVTTKRRGTDRANPLFMLSSVGVLVALKLTTDPAGQPYVAWPWWIIIGTAWTYGFGALYEGDPPVSESATSPLGEMAIGSRRRESNP